MTPRDRLRALERSIDEEARQYKQRRLQEEIAKLAAEDSSAVFPPDEGDVPQDSPPAPDADDHRGAGTG